MKIKTQKKIKRYIKKNFDTTIIVGLLIASAALSGLFIGHAYGFNMTEEQTNETKMLPYCENLDEVWIPILNNTCSFFYGGPVE
jgi:hypothetical protein